MDSGTLILHENDNVQTEFYYTYRCATCDLFQQIGSHFIQCHLDRIFDTMGDKMGQLFTNL